MSNFKEIQPGDDIKEVIKAAFDTEMVVKGEWGYTQELATIIQGSEQVKQTEHTLAMMRAYIEMNMTLEKEERYGSINLNETARESIDGFDKVTYQISAMKEDEYANFIAEYKEGHATPGFDISGHFTRRKEATLIREVTHWFKV